MQTLKRVVTLSILICLLQASAEANTRTIKTVHNTNLIELEGGFTARLTGITVADKQTETGYQAYDFMKRAVEGKVVVISTYTTNNMASGIVHGEDGYPFFEIIYGNGVRSKGWDTNLNAQLLEKGWARVNEKYLPKYLEYFRDLEKEAKAQQLGIWKNEQ